jgi:hypothetical protein
MDEYGKKYYFDWEQRKAENFGDGCDSHSHISKHYGLDEDELNKYEYNPLTKVFEVDQINTIDNRIQAEEWVRKLDWKKIVEPLIIKPIVNPLSGRAKKPNVDRVQMLKEWATVWDTVGATVWTTVWTTVGATVRATVWDTVWDTVRATVWDTVWDTVGATVWDTVGDTVRAYVSSFFDVKYQYDFSPCVRLWDAGFVPSYDGETWRLHSGNNAKIVYEWKPGKDE